MQADYDDTTMSRGQLADRAAGASVRALRAASAIAFFRAIFLPLIVLYLPYSAYAGLDLSAMREIGFAQTGLFALVSVWAVFDPLAASLAAAVFYGVLAWPQVTEHRGWFQQDWITNSVIILALLRSLVMGLVQRSYLSKAPHELIKTA